MMNFHEVTSLTEMQLCLLFLFVHHYIIKIELLFIEPLKLTSNNVFNRIDLRCRQ